MSKRPVILIGWLVVLSLLVIALSSLAVNWQLTARLRSFLVRRGPFIPRRYPFHRWGPFGSHRPGWLGILSALASLTCLYLSSALVLYLFPRQMGVVAGALSAGPRALLRLLGVGVLGSLVVLLLSGLGMFAFLAFPVSLLLPTVGLLVAYLGLVGVSLALGRWLRRLAGLARPMPLAELGLGTLTLFAVSQVPILGWIVAGLAAATALGAILVTRLGSGKPWSLEPLRRI